MEESLAEFISESVIPVCCDEIREKINTTKENLNGFLHYINAYEAACDDWKEWFQMAVHELQECKEYESTMLEEMSDNLDRVQVHRVYPAGFFLTLCEYVHYYSIYTTWVQAGEGLAHIIIYNYIIFQTLFIFIFNSLFD